MTRKADR
ncbi:Protein of unknown function [Propionibacterium freudenreichii]|nr:Protein of unknown function [Propionibacterium freudenreichii]